MKIQIALFVIIAITYIILSKEISMKNEEIAIDKENVQEMEDGIKRFKNILKVVMITQFMIVINHLLLTLK